MHKPLSLLMVLLATQLGCEETIPITQGSRGTGALHVIDNGGIDGDTGWWPSVVIDKEGRAHVAFCDGSHGDLKYTHKTADGVWQTQTILSHGAVGKYTSIAIDSQERIGIVFYDQDHKYLRYAERVAPGTIAPAAAAVKGDAAAFETAAERLDDGLAPGWASSRVGWGLELGMGAELRFDAHDKPHIFYYAATGKLMHALRDSKGEWRINVLDDATGSWSVRIDPVLRDDGFWVSYVDWKFKDMALKLARQDPVDSEHPNAVSFSKELLTQSGQSGWRSQLVFNSPEPLVLYTALRSNDLRIGQTNDGDWQSSQLIKFVGNFAAAHQSGLIAVAYEDIEQAGPGKGAIRLLRRIGGKWSRHEIDKDGPAGAYLDIAMNKEGEVVVAYYAGDIRGLKIYDETK